MPRLAQRLAEVPLSATLAMSAKARELAAQIAKDGGSEIISLALGEPDFPTPDHAIEAAHQAALRGDTKYPPLAGTLALRGAIQRAFKRDHGLDYALDQITVANGGKQIIFNAFLATVDPGDEVVIPAPYWVAYPLVAKLLGGVPVFVDCPEKSGFKLAPRALDAVITPRTKWVTLNFPNNPSGAACTASELAALAEVIRAHPHVWVMSDDIYEHLIFDREPHVTLAQIAPDLADRVLTVSGVSKSYAMTGWRVGFAGGPVGLIKAMVNMQGQATSGVAGVAQAAAAAALDGPQDLLAKRAAVYRQRRDLVVDRLNAIPGLRCHRPEGAFYVFPSVEGLLGKTTPGGTLLETDEDVTLAMLTESHVAVVQGSAFGKSPYIRISTATSEARLIEACERIAVFCRSLR